MLFSLLGIISSVIFLIGDLPYFLDTLKGKTKPQRITWGGAFVLNAIGFANQYASGAGNSLWLFGAATFATGAIFFASLSKGVGGHSKLDIIAIITAILGVGLWIVFDSPLLSVYTTLVVVWASFAPTILKARKHPETETKIAWLFGSISAFLAAISVGELNWTLLVLPLNAAVLQAYMVYILYFEAKKRSELAIAEPSKGIAEL